jgi:gluconolactonase
MMRVISVLAICLGSAAASAQSPPRDPAPHPFSITRSDPALDALIAPNAKLKVVASGFGFIDGPVWLAGSNGTAGYLLASSIIDNVVYKVTPAGKVSVFLDRAGYSGDDFANTGKFAQIGRAHVLLMGPGCTGVDRDGRVVWCAGQDLAI